MSAESLWLVPIFNLDMVSHASGKLSDYNSLPFRYIHVDLIFPTRVQSVMKMHRIVLGVLCSSDYLVKGEL